jgi:hypothetical protein
VTPAFDVTLVVQPHSLGGFEYSSEMKIRVYTSARDCAIARATQVAVEQYHVEVTGVAACEEVP